MFEALYTEFGKEEVHRVRRELTARNDKMPTYIELVAELYLRQGPHNESSKQVRKGRGLSDGKFGHGGRDQAGVRNASASKFGDRNGTCQ